MSNTVQNARAVPWCELIRQPDRYDKQIIQTRASLHIDHDNQFLYAANCESENGSPVWVEFDPSYVYSDEDLKRKLTELVRPRALRPSGNAQVTVVGRFDGPFRGPYGHLDGYRSKFSIIRLQAVEAAEAMVVSK